MLEMLIVVAVKQTQPICLVTIKSQENSLPWLDVFPIKIAVYLFLFLHMLLV